MVNKKKEFKKVCDRIIEIYQNTFEEKITVDDILEQDKFKKIYRKLARTYHTDINQINDNIMKDINDLRDKVKEFLNDPRFISSIVEMSDDEYRKYIISRLREKKEEYKDIWSFFEKEFSDFESMILLTKNKKEMDALYYSFTKTLDIRLKKERFLKEKKEYLRGFVDNNNEENVKLFQEFLDKVNRCNNIGDIAELCKNYEVILAKNDMVFRMKNALIKTYVELKKLMETYDKVNFDGIDIDTLLNSKNQEQLKINYASLKEVIDQRIDFYNRVCAKIGGFLHKYRTSRDYTFTYPFIHEKVRKLYTYYDLSDKDLRKFGRILNNVKKEVEIQKDIDLKLVQEKKERLRTKFNNDYDRGILHESGREFLEYNLSNITTFGDFANFEYRTLRADISRVIGDVYRTLQTAVEELNRISNLPYKNVRKELLNKAIICCNQFQKIYKNTTDFSKMPLSEYSSINYVEFSIKINFLKNIDYIFGDVSEIKRKVNSINEFLFKDLYDENLISSRKK